jgi:hypothetical protein
MARTSTKKKNPSDAATVRKLARQYLLGDDDAGEVLGDALEEVLPFVARAWRDYPSRRFPLAVALMAGKPSLARAVARNGGVRYGGARWGKQVGQVRDILGDDPQGRDMRQIQGGLWGDVDQPIRAAEVAAEAARAKRPNPARTSTKSHTSTRTEVRSPTRTSTSTRAHTAGNVTVTGGAGAGATTSVTIRKNPSLVAVDPTKITPSNTHVIGRLTKIAWQGDVQEWRHSAPVLAYHACGDRTCPEEGKLVVVYAARSSPGKASAEYKRTHWGDIGTGKHVVGVATRIASLAELGPVRNIVYTTRKGGDPAGELVDYDHTFGRDRPILFEHSCHEPKCPERGQLVIAGGGYRVTERGIVG